LITNLENFLEDAYMHRRSKQQTGENLHAAAVHDGFVPESALVRADN
jgi:hypothetical protein